MTNLLVAIDLISVTTVIGLNTFRKQLLSILKITFLSVLIFFLHTLPITFLSVLTSSLHTLPMCSQGGRLKVLEIPLSDKMLFPGNYSAIK